MKKIGILVQARMSSSRFPGKVMQEILGKPMVERVVERLGHCRLGGPVCILTSTDKSDDPLCAFLKRTGILFFRGSLEDVLDRYFQAASKWALEIVVRVTADCPLVDPKLVDDMIEKQNERNADAVFCAKEIPDGFRLNVLTFEALQKAFLNAKLPSEREHVVPYLWNHPAQFRIFYHSLEKDFSAYHLSVDYPEDLELVRTIYERLYLKNPSFALADVVDLLEKDQMITQISKKITRIK